jgi:hypothetical protein
MTARRLLVAAVVMVGTLIGFAPSASAGRAACAWVNPYGVCLSNPLDDVDL